MTSRQSLLFAMPQRARRKLMHVVDAGNAPDGEMVARFRCPRCGHQSRWLRHDTVTEAKRGEPCPQCNSQAGPVA